MGAKLLELSLEKLILVVGNRFLVQDQDIGDIIVMDLKAP